MPDISLTDFVDFVIKAGTPKLTKVTEIKKRQPYSPAIDFWKRLRDGICEYHRNGESALSKLDDILGGVNDPKKQKRYIEAITCYKRFLGRKSVTWFNPPSKIWSHADLNVRLNPELGLVIDGKKNIIKLYLKDEPLTKNRIQVILEMMRMELGVDGTTVSILDVSKSKLISSSLLSINIEPLLKGEATSFVQMWNAI